MDRRLAYVILNMLPGIGPVKMQQLVGRFGAPEAIFSVAEQELLRVPGIGPHLGPVLRHWEKYCDPEAELRLAQAAGVYLATFEDAVYPALLKAIHDPPICLYVRGDLRALANCRQSIAIVGSRHTTSYGMQMAGTLAGAAASAGWTVVSGLARGIDTAAHQAVLKAGGCTVAVIGSGLCQLYPRENLDLAEQICSSGGAVISEFPLHYLPDKKNFPMRNRIISGLSRGTLVVEAGQLSGSLITAAQALEQNRTVFAVPGRVDSPFSRGCHSLLRDGACLVETFQDVVEEFSLLPNLQVKAVEKETCKQDSLPVPLTGLEWSVWEKLSDQQTGIDDLLDRCEEPPSRILGTLLMLEIKQVIRQLPGKMLVRLPGRKVYLES